ncbi:MAG TPA: GNAT family protein [Vulgatibacter sp.]|nr:GNAT family protein [Vulgatibacter sp.]
MVQLRGLEREDLECRVRWLNDPAVQRTLSFDLPVSRAKTEKWFEKTLVQTDRRDLSVVLKPTNRLIGFAGLLNIDRLVGKAEAYVTIGETSEWGKGHATEAYCLLAEYAFIELGLQRIYAYSLPENSGTRRIMEKLGWKHEAVLRRDVWSHGSVKDRLVFSLLKNEWMREGEPAS